MQVHRYVQENFAQALCKWYVHEPLPSRMHAKRAPLTAPFSAAPSRDTRRPDRSGPADEAVDVADFPEFPHGRVFLPIHSRIIALENSHAMTVTGTS
jgi:hypothetical protein